MPLRVAAVLVTLRPLPRPLGTRPYNSLTVLGVPTLQRVSLDIHLKGAVTGLVHLEIISPPVPINIHIHPRPPPMDPLLNSLPLIPVIIPDSITRGLPLKLRQCFPRLLP